MSAVMTGRGVKLGFARLGAQPRGARQKLTLRIRSILSAPTFLLVIVNLMHASPRLGIQAKPVEQSDRLGTRRLRHAHRGVGLHATGRRLDGEAIFVEDCPRGLLGCKCPDQKLKGW
jgi:hypothetical protein